MGYFANGIEGEMFEEKYCENCQHEKTDSFCPVMEAHQLYNYEECNNKNSILHILIPRDEKGYNQPCAMFIEKEDVVNE